MRATSPSGDATFEGEVGWSNELGYGLRAPEPKQTERDASGYPAKLSGIRTVKR
jgi:NADH-quinone oxidoreductase subunit I